MTQKRKILISWIAYKNDFITAGNTIQVNNNGTHSYLYQNAFDYDQHLLLSHSSEQEKDKKVRRLVRDLKDLYAKDVRPIYLDLNINDIVDVKKIKEKVAPIIEEIIDQNLEIFISPGTPAMQTVWYLIGAQFPYIKLFLTRKPDQQPSSLMGKEIREYIQVNDVSYINGLSIAERKSLTPEKLPTDLYRNAQLDKIFELADQIAQSNSTTVILGETGTGKDVIAKRIHNKSNRRNNTFHPINCAGLSDETLYSELFGHIKGAFTGAVEQRDGAFITANKGTIFLDEIGDISSKMQQTLLRVLQDKKFRKLGSDQFEQVDVRILLGTHQNLIKKVTNGTFRADLFYRIHIGVIDTVPVREFSLEDRVRLFQFFIDQLSIEFNCPKFYLSKQAKAALLGYTFPGNIRQVKALIERLYIFRKRNIQIEDIPSFIKNPEGLDDSLKLEDVKLRHIKKVLKMFSGNKTKTREALGIKHKATLEKYIEKLESHNCPLL